MSIHQIQISKRPGAPGYDKAGRRSILLLLLLVGLVLPVLGLTLQGGAEAAPQADVKAGGAVSGTVIHLPAIMKKYEGEKPPGGITGRVTEKGSPAANVSLDLLYFDGDSWSTRATTKTNGNGIYLFGGVASLGSGEVYYVRFGPNESNPAWLAVWFAPDITSHSAGSQTNGGDFDIADVVLLEPGDGATVSMPVTFEWKRRGVPGDGYRVLLFDPDSDDLWITNDLGNVGSITIGSLPPDAVTGKQYGWFVEVYNGPDSYDSYGVSYSFNRVTFSNSARQTWDKGRVLSFVERSSKLEKWRPVND